MKNYELGSSCHQDVANNLSSVQKVTGDDICW